MLSVRRQRVARAKLLGAPVRPWQKPSNFKLLGFYFAQILWGGLCNACFL